MPAPALALCLQYVDELLKLSVPSEVFVDFSHIGTLWVLDKARTGRFNAQVRALVLLPRLGCPCCGGCPNLLML